MFPQSFAATLRSRHEGVFFKSFPKSATPRRFRLKKSQRGNRSFSAASSNKNDLPIREGRISVKLPLDRFTRQHQEKTGGVAFTRAFEATLAKQLAKRAEGKRRA